MGKQLRPEVSERLQDPVCSCSHGPGFVFYTGYRGVQSSRLFFLYKAQESNVQPQDVQPQVVSNHALATECQKKRTYAQVTRVSHSNRYLMSASNRARRAINATRAPLRGVALRETSHSKTALTGPETSRSPSSASIPNQKTRKRQTPV